MKKNTPKVSRNLQKSLEEWLNSEKILIVFGARQVGKTTLVKEILKAHGNSAQYYNCESIAIQQLLESKNVSRIKDFFGEAELVVLDEAQSVSGIGKILKLFIDYFPDFQIIATGSSSFDLASKTSEALTGRALQFVLYPFSFIELKGIYSRLELIEKLPQFMRFGMYPEIVLSNETQKRILLSDLTDKYLYKDILSFENLKKSDLVIKLLQLLALQLGNEVSTHELAKKLAVNRNTIDRYINILEQSFIVFRLKPFGRNLRTEITKKNKIYFFDTGIRNSIIQNLNILELRTDTGALWENFLLMERRKYLQSIGKFVNCYFWRTHDQKEIDYIEEFDGQLDAYEFKWNPKRKSKSPDLFLKTYSNSTFSTINRDNFWKFIGF